MRKWAEGQKRREERGKVKSEVSEGKSGKRKMKHEGKVDDGYQKQSDVGYGEGWISDEK